MKLYPAIRATMGSWPYFVVRMKMREIAKEVDLAEDLFDDAQLRDHMQRPRKDARIKHDIVNYLVDQEDRFFSSIVVAAVGGSPSWQPVEDVEGVDAPTFFSELFKGSVGALMFVEEPQYYVLDGQHRVSAIKLLVEGKAPKECEDEFLDEVLSVIVVLPEDHEGAGRGWRQRYRRLFTSLNRWAKPTDPDTNIIMDEDDRFAILTRRLMTRHSFFSAAGRQKDSYRVRTQGSNLRSGSTEFTTLQTLYGVNQRLLTSATRLQQGWAASGVAGACARSVSSAASTGSGPRGGLRRTGQLLGCADQDSAESWRRSPHDAEARRSRRGPPSVLANRSVAAR